jgi:hypothetical protein|tara:strand:+ start:641 stop:1243 length:603 start_codon:yes stop_codon:yes gene_type:complete
MKWLVIFLFIFSFNVYADVDQTNVNGGNTSIEGGMTTSTTYQDGASSNSTTTSNNTSNIRSAPLSAYAPSVNSSGIDVCSTGASLGVQTFGFGMSGGKSFRDENCERIKLSRQLDSMGMKVAAVSLLCQDSRVFFAMENSGTPCPYEGKIGKEATVLWKKYNKLRPDYKMYTEKLKIVEDQKRKEELKFIKEMDKATKKK